MKKVIGKGLMDRPACIIQASDSGVTGLVPDLPTIDLISMLSFANDNGRILPYFQIPVSNFLL